MCVCVCVCVYIYIYIYYMCIEACAHISWRFVGNLQPTNCNVKLLQYYGIFLKLLNLSYIKVKDTPQPCDDTAHQTPFQETLHTPCARWSRDPEITSPHAKIQD